MKFPQKLKQKRKTGDLLYINWKISQGVYQREYFGDWNDPNSHLEYEKRKAVFLLKNETGFNVKNDFLTINELVVQFLDHAKVYYRKNGRSTGTAEIFANNLKILCNLYGNQKTSEFDFAKLETIQKSLDESGYLTRKEINRRIARIKQVFKWGVPRKFVPREVSNDIAFVSALQKDRCFAQDRPKITAVPIVDVEKTLVELSSVVGAMVRIQLLTGMRPGEVRLMRLCDLDMTGELWIYTPSEDKMEHHRGENDRKKIPIGPKCQAILTSFLIDRQPDDYLFRPEDSVQEVHAKRRSARKSKMTPSQRRRMADARKHPKKYLPFYTRDAYHHAIQRAAKRAGVPLWHPHQLRHTAATEIQRKYGWRQAQSVLGHSSVDTTKIYVDENFDLACQIIRDVG